MTSSRNHFPDSVRYSVQAVRDPASLPRTLELFALRNIVPDSVTCLASADDVLMITLVVSGISAHDAGVLGRKVGQLVTTIQASTDPSDDAVAHVIPDRLIA